MWTPPPLRRRPPRSSNPTISSVPLSLLFRDLSSLQNRCCFVVKVCCSFVRFCTGFPVVRVSLRMKIESQPLLLLEALLFCCCCLLLSASAGHHTKSKLCQSNNTEHRVTRGGHDSKQARSRQRRTSGKCEPDLLTQTRPHTPPHERRCPLVRCRCALVSSYAAVDLLLT